VVNDFNDRPFLYRNQFPRHNFAEFRPLGAKSNRDAIDAVMKLRCGERIMARQVQASGGYFSQSSRILHIGLGDCQHIDHAGIRWPSGIRQTIESPPVNQFTEIVERVLE
jgi:enediyne biosynthesis protein E4